MIGQMNCYITIKAFDVTQNVDGDIVLGSPTSWNKWANVSQSNGNLLISNGMTNFTEAFDINMWYEPTKPTQANYEIDYDGKKMKIYSVRLDNEGSRTKEKIIAYTSN